jgi:hypothetical protein
MTRGWLLIAIAGCADPISPHVTVVGKPEDAPAVRTWRPASPAPFSAAISLLLTDGTIMTQELDSEQWWRLTPDDLGSYEHGVWSRRASTPAGYSPLYSATSILPDGKVIVEGGEYNAGNTAFTTDGALYDPVADSWMRIHPPITWGTIGDAEGIVLPDGRFMLSNATTKDLALFDEATATWTETGSGKQDINDEESWTLLPDDTIITVDANNVARPRTSEIFSPQTLVWSAGGDTPIQISDLDPDGSGSHEIGPEILRPDGTVLALGAKGQNLLYDSTSRVWSQTADLPMVGGQQFDVADGPGALLPSGDVLVAASPGVFGNPTLFFEFDGTAFNMVDAPPNAPGNSSFNNFMLLLPTGELWLTDFSQDIELYTPASNIVQTAVPVITAVAPLTEIAAAGPSQPSGRVELLPLTTLSPGITYKITGTQLAGISMGAYYGDDYQSSTNYPLVRLTNEDSKHVVYCRTHHHGTRSIAPHLASAAQFDVPTATERGRATLEVITNGIASPAVVVNVK